MKILTMKIDAFKQENLTHECFPHKVLCVFGVTGLSKDTVYCVVHTLALGASNENSGDKVCYRSGTLQCTCEYIIMMHLTTVDWWVEEESVRDIAPMASSRPRSASSSTATEPPLSMPSRSNDKWL